VRLVRLAPRLVDRIAPMRRELALDLGIVAPSVVVREGERLEPNQYVIQLRGVPVARGTALPGDWLAVNEGGAREALEGTPAVDPIFGRPAFWIAEGATSRARELGYVVAEATSVIAAHLRSVIRDRAAELLTRDDVGSLLKALRERRPAVVDEVVPSLVKTGELQKVLQNLLREGVSIRDLGTILERLGDAASRTKDADVLTEQVRAGLARQICQKHVDADGKLYVITLDPRVEDAVHASTVRTEAGPAVALPPDAVNRIGDRLSREVDRLSLAGRAPVVLCSTRVRAAVKRIAEAIRPGIAVLSHDEVVREVQIVTGGVIGD
jgi:flagellar biosynthesis protein FlhA